MFGVMYQHVSPPTVNNTQQANELEHFRLMVFANPFVIFFFFSPLTQSSSFFLSLACHRCFSLSLQQTGIYWQEEKLDLPQERGVQSPAVCIQQMQRAGPSATSSRRHMGLRDSTQEGNEGRGADVYYLFIYLFCQFDSVPQTESNQKKKNIHLICGRCKC